MSATPRIVVLSAPSGGGKTTIANAIVDRRDDTDYSVSATTRSPRPGERDGVDYYFLSREEFARRRDADELLEWAEYSGNLYGTLRSEIERLLGSGRHALLDIEIDGTRKLRERQSQVVTIFILPPSADVLVARLGGRQSDSREQVRDRIRRALDELAEAPRYDHIVVNDDLETCVAEVSALIDGRADQIRPMSDLSESLAEISAGLERYLARSQDDQA